MRIFLYAHIRCYLHAVANVFFICGRPKFFKHAVAIENGHRGIKTEIVTKVVPVRAVNLSIGPFCTEFRCEQLCDDDIFRDRGQLLNLEIGLRDINTEIVTKMVPVRAVDLSIGPFCTEFRHERFCDDAVFKGKRQSWSENRPRRWEIDHRGRESSPG